MAANKNAYFEQAAKGFAASTKLYRVDSVVHVEDKNDIWFWEALLLKYRKGRYKFLPATTNESGNRTTGCTECLKYKEFLTQKFFICIDSDFEYLLNKGLSAQQGVLQTYTYSWENHCAFGSKLQQLFKLKTGKGETFDFTAFLHQYSKIVYKPFLFMLYQERNRLTDFKRKHFKQCINLQYQKGDILNNGHKLLTRLGNNLTQSIGDAIDNSDFEFQSEVKFYAALGLNEENVYLYVRGHCLYNCLLSIGKKLCEGTSVHFEQDILQSALAYDQYEEIAKIKRDIYSLSNLRKEL